MFKKLLLFSLAILLSFSVVSSLGKDVQPVEAAVGHTEIGFYEVMDNGGYIKVNGTFGSYDSATIVNRPGDPSVSINLKSLPTYNNGKVNIADIGGDEAKLTLGFVYTLKLKSGSNTVFSGDFKFVTKAIGNKEELRVINLTDPKVAITGYYALENDLVLARGEENSNNVTMSYTTLGFRGTFDGMGHCITFCANPRGFFGVLGGKAVIKDVAFTDVTLYQNGLCPVIAKENSGSSSGPIYIENVYVRMKSGQLPCGGITQAGSIYHHINNVIVEAPGLNVNSENSGILTVGLLYGHDWAWWSSKTDETGKPVPDIKTYSEHRKDLYFIGNAPLKYYYDGRAQGIPGYFYNSEGHLNRYWMQGFATNEGVEEDMLQCKKVYKGTKKYLTSAEMLADKTNDYSTFNSYWDTTTFGIPVWKTDIQNRYELFMSTEADHTTSRAYLQLGSKDEATLGFGFNGISIDTDITYKIIEGEGVVSVSSNGFVKALKVGEAKVEVTCKYNGKDFSKKFSFEVEAPAGTNPDPNPNPGDDTQKGGCGTVNFTGTGIGGGALLIIGSFAFMMLRRKKYE